MRKLHCSRDLKDEWPFMLHPKYCNWLKMLNMEFTHCSVILPPKYIYILKLNENIYSHKHACGYSKWHYSRDLASGNNSNLHQIVNG